MRLRAALLVTALVATSCGEPAPVAGEPASLASDSLASDTLAPDVFALEVDENGYFVSVEPAAGEVHGGPGVVCLAPARGETAGRTLVGRLDAAEPSPALHVRLPDGSFERRPVVVRSSAADLSVRLLAALAGTDGPAEGAAREFFEILKYMSGGHASGSGPESPPPPPRTYVPPPARFPPGDSELATWAGPDDVFVRFRSVDAAYRFVGLADRLASSLLTASGVGRDHGTVRLALHDLQFPAIWRTNPEGEIGVGEVGLVIPVPPRRGRLDVAVILRITHPDLHRMQATAGLSYDALDDHQWRPEDDPFPELRERRGARTELRGVKAGEVQIVATGSAYGDVATGSRRPLAEDPGFLAARRSAETDPPAGSQAFFLYVPDEAAAFLRDRRELEFEAAMRSSRQVFGLRELAWRWTGLRATPPPDHGPWRTPPLSDLLGRVRWITAHTTVRGAIVRVEARDEEAAARIERLLAAPPADAVAVQRACRTNLADLVPLALVEPRADDLAERCFVWLGWRPVCASGGTYRAHPVTAEPSCTAHGSERRSREGGAAPATGVSQVTRNGRRVRFQLAISWSRRE